METKYIIFIIIGVALLILICSYIKCLNSLKKYKLKIKEALSGIDVALSKRYSIITNLVNIVKGAAKHEKEILFNIVEYKNNMSLKELKNVNASLDEVKNKVNILVEKYPDLKTSSNFLNLQKALIDCEEHLSASRRVYNANTSIYNEKVITFPSLIVAKIHGFKEEEYFKISSDEKDININLSE